MSDKARSRLDKINKAKTGNVARFNSMLDEASKKLVPEIFTSFLKKISLEALKRIVEKTPRDTGRAAGNWRLSLKTPRALSGAASTGARTSQDEIYSKALSKLEALEYNDTVWISNNLDYIIFLENGSSEVQAPQGMVRVTLEELELRYEDAS